MADRLTSCDVTTIKNGIILQSKRNLSNQCKFISPCLKRTKTHKRGSIHSFPPQPLYHSQLVRQRVKSTTKGVFPLLLILGGPEAVTIKPACGPRIFRVRLNRFLYFKVFHNRPRPIYQYSNMAPMLSGQTSIFVVVFFVSKSLLGISQLKRFTILTRQPWSHFRIFIYRTWRIQAD